MIQVSTDIIPEKNGTFNGLQTPNQKWYIKNIISVSSYSSHFSANMKTGCWIDLFIITHKSYKLFMKLKPPDFQNHQQKTDAINAILSRKCSNYNLNYFVCRTTVTIAETLNQFSFLWNENVQIYAWATVKWPLNELAKVFLDNKFHHFFPVR